MGNLGGKTRGILGGKTRRLGPRAGPASVAGDVWIDGAGPVINTARERLDVLEPLVSKPHGDREGTGAVVAENDDRLVRVKLLMGSRGYLAHGHEQGAREGGGVELPRLADIQEEGRVRLLTLLGKNLYRDFGFKHEIKDNVGTKVSERPQSARAVWMRSL